MKLSITHLKNLIKEAVEQELNNQESKKDFIEYVNALLIDGGFDPMELADILLKQVDDETKRKVFEASAARRVTSPNQNRGKVLLGVMIQHITNFQPLNAVMEKMLSTPSRFDPE